MKVKDIIKKYLNENGYDGLFFPGECACKKDDLRPCESGNMDCEAGYLIESTCSEHDWHIGPEKTTTIDVCGGGY